MRLNSYQIKSQPARARVGSKESGVALATVALVLLLLTVLIVAAHYTLISQTTSTAGFRNSTQAFYVAEAGVQRAIDWFSHAYKAPSPTNPPNWDATSPALQDSIYPNKLANSKLVTLVYPDPSNNQSTFPIAATVSGTANSFRDYLDAVNRFNAGPGLRGEYTVTATLLSSRLVDTFASGPARVERWRINAVGRLINNDRNNVISTAENVAVIETLIKPATSHAICAGSFGFSGGAFTVDSYDSSLGTYAATVQDDGSIGSYATSTGPFNLGSGSIGGMIDVPPSFQSSGLCAASAGCGTNFCDDIPSIPNFCPSTSAAPGAGAVNATPNPNGTPATFTFTAVSTKAVGGTAPNDGPGCTMPGPGIPATANGGDLSDSASLGLPAAFSGDAYFWFRNVNLVGGNRTLTINNLKNRLTKGKLNIYIDSLTTSGNGGIVIESNKDNPVNLFVKTSLSAGGNAITNDPSNALGLFLFFKGTNPVTYAGTPQAGLVLVSPDAMVTQLSGTADIFGAIITKNFQGNGNIGVHFDRALEKNLKRVANFVPNSEVRRIF